MTGVIFMDTLRRSWRTVLWWSLGVGSITALQIVAIPDANAIRQIGELLESMPPAMLQLFGAGSDMSFYSTPEGYLSLQFFGFILLVFAIYGIFAGLNITINEEDRGIMDVVLSLPTPRWQVVVERFAAYTVNVIVIVLVTFLFLWGGLLVTPALQVNMQRMVEGTINIVPGTLLTVAITMLLGVTVRRRGAAMTLAFVFVLGSYFLDTIGRSASESVINQVRAISFFAYYNGENVIKNGLSLFDMTVLLGATVIALVLSVFIFQRRDIGV